MLLALDDPLWAELQHAYGSAGDIPGLLSQILGGTAAEEQVWFKLWSALAHQGDVYQASFAAVPHIVEAIAAAPERTTFNHFGFVSWVEICRVRHGLVVDPRLQTAYEASLDRIPELATRVPSESRDSDLARSALSAIAVAWSLHDLGEAIQDLDSETLPDFRHGVRTARGHAS
jgi:hypothetical protein